MPRREVLTFEQSRETFPLRRIQLLCKRQIGTKYLYIHTIWLEIRKELRVQIFKNTYPAIVQIAPVLYDGGRSCVCDLCKECLCRAVRESRRIDQKPFRSWLRVKASAVVRFSIVKM